MAKTWMYQIQGLDLTGAVDVLAETEYPLLVLEPGHNYRDGHNYDTASIIASLGSTPEGVERLLLAYVDIG